MFAEEQYKHTHTQTQTKQNPKPDSLVQNVNYNIWLVNDRLTFDTNI